MQRWASPDPLEVHGPGESGEANLYAYVSGQALRGIDPLGLECGENESCHDGTGTEANTDDDAYASEREPNQSNLPPPPMRTEAPTAPTERKDCHGGCQLNPTNPDAQDAFEGFATATTGMVVGTGCAIGGGGTGCALLFGGMLTSQATGSPDAPADAKGSERETQFWGGALEGAVTPIGQIRPPTQSQAKRLLNRALKRQGLDTPPAQFKEKWSEGGYDYEVRIHPAETDYGKTGDIYRVGRRAQATDAKGQGSGWEYADDVGGWHPQSTLKPGKPDHPNPNYNEAAARGTHIKVVR